MTEEATRDSFGHFEMTRDGYVLAVEYLKKIGKYDLYKHNDGYSVVYAANYNLWKINNGESQLPTPEVAKGSPE